MSDRPEDLPFDGLKVLDISQGLAGPYCGEMLAKQGADVVKVEPPVGDWVRQVGQRYGDNTAISFVANIGKRAIAIDAAKSDGKAVLRRLAESADVVIQNFRLGVAERLGVGADDLMAVNPDLVYVSVFGFGHEGDWARRPATDTIAQGYSGLMFMTGGPGDPKRLPFPIIDLTTGVFAGQRAAAALYKQARGRGGSHVKVSLLEAGAAFQASPMLEAALQAAAGEGAQTMNSLGAPMGVFKAADSYLNLSCVGDPMFRAIGRVLGVPAWIDGPDFATIDQRRAREDEITAETAARLATGKREEWIEAFVAEGVLCGPVNTYGELMADPQAAAIGLFDNLDAPSLGAAVPVVRLPGDAPTTVRRHAPETGEDSVAILQEAGYGQSEIEALLASGAVAAGPAVNPAA